MPFTDCILTTAVSVIHTETGFSLQLPFPNYHTEQTPASITPFAITYAIRFATAKESWLPGLLIIEEII